MEFPLILLFGAIPMRFDHTASFASARGKKLDCPEFLAKMEPQAPAGAFRSAGECRIIVTVVI